MVSGGGQPDVSVVVPLYNKAATVVRCIESVLGQQGATFEIVVADDGSTDDSYDVVARHFGNRVNLLRQANQGPAAARNLGAAAARAALIVFVDADDELLPGNLAAHLECRRRRSDVQLSLCSFRQEDPSGNGRVARIAERVPSLDADGPFRYADHLEFDLVTDTGSSFGVDRSLFEKSGGFDASLRCWEITELVFRLSMAAARVGVIGDVLVLLHEDQANSQFERARGRVQDITRVAGLLLDGAERLPAAQARKCLVQVNNFCWRLLHLGAYPEFCALSRRLWGHPESPPGHRKLRLLARLPVGVVRHLAAIVVPVHP